MTDDCEKLDLPEQPNQEEEKKEAPKTMEQKFLQAVNQGGVVFDLDNCGITTLKSLP